MTTNEVLKRKKYEYLTDANGNFKNIFNQGIIYNIKYFFHFAEPSDLERYTFEYASDKNV
jgi:hypothetical protein